MVEETVVITAVDIRRAAMDLLARREHGYHELINKLLRRFSRVNSPKIADFWSDPDGEMRVPTADGEALSLRDSIDQQLSKLRDEGLQSDSRLADAFIRARSNRGQGPIKIKAELRGKGLSDSIIGSAFETCEVDWYELLESVSSRRFGTAVTDAKVRARRNRFLQQRGFCFDHIKAIDIVQ